MRDIKMINELGLGTGGRLDNFILVGEDNVINTELRFPDEFIRHKVGDIVGDLALGQEHGAVLLVDRAGEGVVLARRDCVAHRQGLGLHIRVVA